MIRHPDNTNLILHNGSTFQNWPIQEDKGPFIQQYLHRLQQTMQYALAQYPRVFAFRVDLRLNCPEFSRHSPSSLCNAFQTLP